MISWITDRIAVGGHDDLDASILSANGIARLVIVVPPRKPVLVLAPVVLVAPWHDDNNLMELYEALGFIDQAVNEGVKVLVACGGGLERAPTTLVAYFVYNGVFLEDAVNFVRGAHPASQIHVEWLLDVGFNLNLYPEV